MSIYEEENFLNQWKNAEPAPTPPTNVSNNDLNAELIYPINSVKKLKLLKLTNFFAKNILSNHSYNIDSFNGEWQILFDFCFDWIIDPTNDQMSTRMNCFINYLDQIITAKNSYKLNITILIRGCWLPIYDRFKKLNPDIKVYVRSNTINLPEDISFLKIN